MSSPHADDVFSMRFDDAVGKAHQHLARGNSPSAGLWSDIRSQMRSDIVDSAPTSSAAPEPKPSRPMRTAATTTQPRSQAVWPQTTSRTQRQRVLNWISVGLIVGLIVSGLYLNLFLPTTNGNKDQQLAWAPSTVTSDPAELFAIASPWASPSASMWASPSASPWASPFATPWASPTAIEYGPEFACNVEPLTADIVLDMVINPDRELNRRGAENSETPLSQPNETGGDTIYWRWLFSDKVHFGIIYDLTELQPITDTANQFWNCLMTGTAYQVWALMYPSTVQHEILKNFPVFRDEDALRTYIERWGPRSYNQRAYLDFPDLSMANPVDVSMHADQSVGSTTMSNDVSGEFPESAIVLMIPHSDSGLSPLNYRELLLRRAPDGTWWVVAINYPDNLRGRG